MIHPLFDLNGRSDCAVLAGFLPFARTFALLKSDAMASGLKVSTQDPTEIFDILQKLGEGCVFRALLWTASPNILAVHCVCTRSVRCAARMALSSKPSTSATKRQWPSRCVGRWRPSAAQLCLFVARTNSQVLDVENDDRVQLEKEIHILKECNSEYIVAYKGSFEKNGKLWVRCSSNCLRVLTAVIRCCADCDGILRSRHARPLTRFAHSRAWLLAQCDAAIAQARSAI